jgi:hypothetical protein
VSGSTRRKFLFLCTLLLSPLAAWSTFLQQSIPLNQETVLTFVHDFLQVFYPELFDKDHRVTLCVTTPGDDSWRELAGVYFTITPREVNPLVTPEGSHHILLKGRIWLPLRQYGRVQELNASSEAVHEQKLSAIRQTVELHPEWSDAQAVNALKQAGARFGPADKEAFVNSLPFNKTERFLGQLKISSVEFNHLGGNHTGHFAANTLDWTVRAETQLPDGTSASYFFTFEPFEGKLTYLMRR